MLVEVWEQPLLPTASPRSHPSHPAALVAAVSSSCQHHVRAVPAPRCTHVPAVVGAETPVLIPACVTAWDRLRRCRCTSRHATAPHQIIAIKSCCEQLTSLPLPLPLKCNPCP